MRELDEKLRQIVLQKVDLTRDVTDEEILECIQQEICNIGKKQHLSLDERLALQRRIFHSLRRLDVLEDLITNDDITEIMVNGYNNIFIEMKGRIIETDLSFASEEKLQDVVQKIVGANNKVANATHPIVDTRLSDGSRVNIVLPPIAVDGGALSIRKFPKDHITMKHLLSWGSVSQEIVDFVRDLVLAKYNIFVSGSTSSGKTTFLNAMAEFIPEDERVITVEDSAELQLLNVKNLVRLEAREATLEGKLEVSIRDLMKTTLRMRPDRIIVGECRGREALEVLQSFGTGHDGSFSTGHANSAKDMLSRLETMALMAGEMPLPAIRAQIVSGVDIIIHLGRLRDRSRKLLQIMEVVGMEDGEILLRPIYEYDQKERQWKKRNELLHHEKMDIANLAH